MQQELQIVTEGLRFPEGPVAMPDGTIALVEIAAQRITRVAPDGTKSTIAEVPGGPNGLAIGPGGQMFVCNNGGFAWAEQDGRLRPSGQSADYCGGRIETVDPATGKVTRLYDRVGDVTLKGPNDLIFDGQGGFWFTDLGKSRARDRDHGGLYWAAEDGSRVVEVAHPIPGGANGVGLSPDGRTVYVAETETGRLWAWDITGPGGAVKKQPWPSPHGGRLVCQFPGFRRLDSLAMAASGNIVVATLVAGEITTVQPDGHIVGVCKMPDVMPTNICFGGPRLRHAWITLSNTGRLATMIWPETGMKLPY